MSVTEEQAYLCRSDSPPSTPPTPSADWKRTLIAPCSILLVDRGREVVDMQRPMEEVMDVVEDRRWLTSCNPRAETVGRGRR